MGYKKSRSGVYLPPHTGLWSFNESTSPVNDHRGFAPIAVTGGTFTGTGLTINETSAGNYWFGPNDYATNCHQFSLYYALQINTSAVDADLITTSDGINGNGDSYQWYHSIDAGGGSDFYYAISGATVGDFGNRGTLNTGGISTSVIYHFMLGYLDRAGTNQSYLFLNCWKQGDPFTTVYTSSINNAYNMTGHASYKLGSKAVTAATLADTKTYYKMAFFNNCILDRPEHLVATVQKYWNL